MFLVSMLVTLSTGSRLEFSICTEKQSISTLIYHSIRGGQSGTGSMPAIHSRLISVNIFTRGTVLLRGLIE